MYNTKNILSTDNKDFTRIMLEIFVRSVSEFNVEIKQALNNEDLIKITEIAHRVKPSIEILEIQGAVPIIKEIENATTINDHLRNQIHLIIKILNGASTKINNDLKT